MISRDKITNLNTYLIHFLLNLTNKVNETLLEGPHNNSLDNYTYYPYFITIFYFTLANCNYSILSIFYNNNFHVLLKKLHTNSINSCN